MFTLGLVYATSGRSLYRPVFDTDHSVFFLQVGVWLITNHVGCQHAVKLSVADQTVQIESDVLYCHRIP